MGSLVAFFHKHYDIQERKFKAANRMRKEVNRIQKVARRHWFKCGKCREIFKEEELKQVAISPEVNEWFCKSCRDMMKLARDDY